MMISLLGITECGCPNELKFQTWAYLCSPPDDLKTDVIFLMECLPRNIYCVKYMKLIFLFYIRACHKSIYNSFFSTFQHEIDHFYFHIRAWYKSIYITGFLFPNCQTKLTIFICTLFLYIYSTPYSSNCTWWLITDIYNVYRCGRHVFSCRRKIKRSDSVVWQKSSKVGVWKHNDDAQLFEILKFDKKTEQ